MMTVSGRGNETVWDVEKNQPLMKFKDGFFQTEDKDIARKLQSLGYRVEGMEKEEQEEKAPQKEPDKTPSPDSRKKQP